MKKRNLILGFLFAILASLTFGISPKQYSQTHAAGVVTITFDANEGVCDVSTLPTNDDGTLPQLPNATKDGWYFIGWQYNDALVEANATVFAEDATVLAIYSLKTYTYTISNNSGILSAIGHTFNDLYTYPINSPSADLSSLIAAIKADANLSKTTTINLSGDITLEEDLVLDIPLLTLSGSIDLQSHSINYNVPSANSLFTLNNFTLNSNSNQNLINISGNNKVSVYLSNCTFNNTSGTNNYTLYIDNPSTSIFASDKLSYQTTYFYNHNSGTVANMNNVDPSQQTSGKYSITVPYHEDGSLIVTSRIDASYFEFVSLQDNYSCEVYKNSNDFLAAVEFEIQFDTNGGAMNDTLLSTSTSFQRYSNLNYPTGSDLTKTHCSLNGFAGTFTLTTEQLLQFNTSTTEWFFDTNSVNSYLANTDASKTFLDFCYDKLPEANNNGFTNYNYDSNFKNPNFIAVVLMLDLNVTPRFIALWSDTIYHVTFDTMGGSAVAQNSFSGIFGSALPSLPATSKTGYTFAGWYTSSSFEDDSLKTNDNFNVMPDTNPTLYAKWTANSYTLTIYPNNDSETLTRTIIYNTPLSSIIELESDYFSKTGHSFSNWHDKPLNDAESQVIDISTYLMPDNNVNLYASWTKKQYTITLKINHPKNTDDYVSLTVDFESDIQHLKTNNPSFDGYEFRGWLTDSQTKYVNTYPYLPDTMPAEDITLYASWKQLDYKIYYHLNEYSTYETQTYHFEDTIVLPSTPVFSGLIFKGWFTSPELSEAFALRTMPIQDIHLYAKMINKGTLKFNTTPQSYSLSQNKGFVLNISLSNVKIEYLVNDKWQTEIPKSVGVYDVKVTRYEDSQYNAINTVIEKGLEITLNPISLSLYSLILYFIAGVEIICAIIIMLMRKQRQTYLNYAIALPFGLVSNSDFINFIIALILALFGFVMMIIQFTKLRKVNIEISKISDEIKEYTPPDVSTNETITKNVDILLQKEGFFSANKDESKDEDLADEDDLNSDFLGDDDEINDDKDDITD